MKKALTDLNTNTILQGVLTILVWGTISYLYIAGREVPDALLGAGGIILGFYFHATAQAALMARSV
jgi:hypothetical protein